MISKKKLKAWVDEGIIDVRQAEALWVYESMRSVHLENERGGSNWVLYGIVGIGVTAIATGIVSLVAANWWDIPDVVKLGIYFVLQFALGVGFLTHFEKPGVAREGLLTLFLLAILGGIGLIGQVFHLQGDTWGTLYLWSALAFPALCFAQSRYINHLWFAAFAFATSSWIGAHSPQSTWVPLLADHGARAMLGIGMVAVFGALGFWRADPAIPEYFARAARVWTVGLTAQLSVALALTQHFRGSLAAYQQTLYLPFFGLLLLFGSLAASAHKWPHRAAFFLGGFFLGAFAHLALSIYAPPGMGTDIFGVFLFTAYWGCAAASAAFFARRRLYDLATFVIGARFVALYFELFASMALTGIGLIISGGVILGAAFIWYRYRDRLTEVLR